MPMPPWREMPMARRDSVTVSIAAEASGMLMVSLRVNCVVVSASVGRTEDLPGRSRTSSNVRPSEIGSPSMETSRARMGRGTARRHKQRSPGGKRWAGGQMQPIEKMSHGELSILGAAGREGQVTVGEGPDNDSDLHPGHRRQKPCGIAHFDLQSGSAAEPPVPAYPSERRSSRPLMVVSTKSATKRIIMKESSIACKTVLETSVVGHFFRKHPGAQQKQKHSASATEIYTRWLTVRLQVSRIQVLGEAAPTNRIGRGFDHRVKDGFEEAIVAGQDSPAAGGEGGFDGLLGSRRHEFDPAYENTSHFGGGWSDAQGQNGIHECPGNDV